MSFYCYGVFNNYNESLKGKRNNIFDIIRCIAVLMLPLIHSAGNVNSVICEDGTTVEGVVLYALNCLLVPVPLFLMLSGGLLLGKEEEIGVFYRKRAQRVLVPFLLWSPIVFILRYIVDGGRSIIGCLSAFIHDFLYIGAHNVYWYVYLIVVLYLITPYIRKVVANSTYRELSVFIGILFGMVVVTSLFDNILVSRLFRSKALVFLFYYVFGYWCSVTVNNLVTSRSQWVKIQCTMTFLLMWMLHIVNWRFIHLPIITTVLLACSMYGMLLSYSDRLHEKSNWFVNIVCKYSYGIYLTHVIFIGALSTIGIEKTCGIAFPLVALLVTIPSCICMLAAMEWCLSKANIRINIY